MTRNTNAPSAVAEGGAHPFRTQAIASARGRQYGSVILRRPVSHTVMVGLFSAIALAIVAFFAFFETTRKVQCSGVLAPTAGVIRVRAVQAGVVRTVNVREGVSVKAGDILFVLSSERSNAGSLATQETISALLEKKKRSYRDESLQLEQQFRERHIALRKQIENLSATAERLSDQIALQRRRVRLANDNVARFSDLQRASYISTAQMQEKQAELLDQEQRLAELLRLHASSERELVAARAEIDDSGIQAQRERANLDRNISSLEQDIAESEARRESYVRATQDGVVSAVTTEPGQLVGPNAVLASILPQGSALEAEIYVPSRSIGFVKPGMPVLLRYQAYPYQKFGQYPATIREIGSTSIPADGLPATVAAQQEPMYRLRLKLEQQSVHAYGRAMPLKSGMTVDGSVLLEHRKLYEWILEPLFSISGRV